MLSVGVVIPVYNRPGLAVEAIRDVWAQRRPPDQLVVVDDGSTDDTAGAARRLIAASNPPCPTALIQKPNGGGASANNFGAESLRHLDLLAVHDSDDLWPADYLGRMTAALERQPGAVAASGDRVTVDVATGERVFRSTSFAQGAVTQRFFDDAAPIPSITVMRTSRFFEAGRFDEGLRCPYDQALFLRMSTLGPWAYAPGEPVQVRRGIGAQSGGEPNLTSELDRPAIRASYVWLHERLMVEERLGERVAGWDWRRALAAQWFQLGKFFHRRGERGHAAWCFRRAVELAPRWGRGWRWRLLTLLAAAERPYPPEPPRPSSSRD